MSVQNSLVLLNRILSLKDGFPFVLVVDSLAQSSHYMVQEFAWKASNDIIYLSFETVHSPGYSAHYIDCVDLKLEEIVDKVHKITSGLAKKCLILIDSLNYIPIQEVTRFVTSLITANSIILGVYHSDFECVLTAYPNFPSHLSVLSYISTSIFEVQPTSNDEEVDNQINNLKIPSVKTLNSPVFKLILTNRRKSGRAMKFKFIINSLEHKYEIYKESTTAEVTEDEALLKDLTTFNLTTNLKQKLAKEQVDLPFMQAQEELGSYSGAIVYEFEKDDDYDEDDPYEDPF